MEININADEVHMSDTWERRDGRRVCAVCGESLSHTLDECLVGIARRVAAIEERLGAERSTEAE